jgi:protease IV
LHAKVNITPEHDRDFMAKKRWIILAIVIASFVLVFGSMIGLILVFAGLETGYGNVAVIPIEGVIMTGSGNSLLGEQVASSGEIVRLIRQAEDDKSVKAIVFEINSPGGSPVASDEIANEIKGSDKLTVAVIRDVGASGAYWVASSCDHIIANRMSITGSIGVIASYLEFSGTLRRYNVTYQRLVSGDYKDMGSAYKPLTKDEEDIMQQLLDDLHTVFIQTVSENRALSEQEVERLATGQIYLGSRAMELGLVDGLGGREDALTYIADQLDIEPDVVEYRRKSTFLDALAGTVAGAGFNIGRGFAFQLMSLKPAPVIPVA